MINLIVAYDENRSIGKNDKIPWYIPEELSFFKEITTNHVCVMGRKTWESLPDKFRPLPNRKNVVISGTYKNYPDSFIKTITNLNKFEDVWTTDTPKSALSLCRMNWSDKDIFVIGGYQIYKYFLENSLIDKMLVSEIKGSYGGDVYFPEINEEMWEVQMIRSFDKFNSYKYIKK